MSHVMVTEAARDDVELLDGAIRVTFHRQVPATPGDDVELVVDGEVMGRWRVLSASMVGEDVVLELGRDETEGGGPC
jgi:hypothetical protein